jgi:hypothetical protein
MAIALSGSPAVLSACMALCLDNPATAGATQADHSAHGMAEPAAASLHAHQGADASVHSAISGETASRPAPSDARLVRTCDTCCIAGPVALAAGPGIERIDGKAFAMAPSAAVALHQVSVATDTAAPPHPPVPPPSPTRAPLALRI